MASTSSKVNMCARTASASSGSRSSKLASTCFSVEPSAPLSSSTSAGTPPGTEAPAAPRRLELVRELLCRDADRLRRDGTHRRDAHGDLGAKVARHGVEQPGAVVRRHVGEDHRDRLRVLVDKQRARRVIGSAWERSARGPAAALLPMQVRHDLGGAFLADGRRQHAARLGKPALADRPRCVDLPDELLENPADDIPVEGRQIGDLGRQASRPPRRRRALRIAD